MFARFFLLETHRDQLVNERAGGFAEGRFGKERVGAVQIVILSALGIRHPQHTAEKLFDILRTLDACN